MRNLEFKCPGCDKMIAGFVLPEHFKICDGLHGETDKPIQLNVEDEEDRDLKYLSSISPVVYQLENSKNWFILFYKLVGHKHVFYVHHFCGEEKKETFNFEMKIFGGSEFLLSLNAKCSPLGLGVEDAIRTGNKLEISKIAMKENPVYAVQRKSRMSGVFKVMPSPVSRCIISSYQTVELNGINGK